MIQKPKCTPAGCAIQMPAGHLMMADVRHDGCHVATKRGSFKRPESCRVNAPLAGTPPPSRVRATIYLRALMAVAMLRSARPSEAPLAGLAHGQPVMKINFALFAEGDATGLPLDPLFQPTLLAHSPALLANLTAALAEARPQFIVSAGDKSKFGFLDRLPARLHATWTHVDAVHTLTTDKMEALYWRSLQVQHQHSSNPSQLLLSAFTPAFKSGTKLMIPYTSLLSQTHQNWEWVVYDDSPPDHTQTWALLNELAAKDLRVRPIRGTANDGYIGSVKRRAAGAASGELLVELDHDDVLLPSCFEYLAAAAFDNPDAGFFYSDDVEMMAGSNKSVEYGTFWAFNDGAHYRTLLDGAWVGAATAAHINSKTLRHIVSMPNHVRVWRRSAYHELGGHARGLPVADDYDMSVRSFARYPAVYVRHMLYLQWRQPDASTFTFKRNALIQRLVKIVSQKADLFDIHRAFVRANLTDTGSGSFSRDTRTFWEKWETNGEPLLARQWRHEARTANADMPYVSIVMTTYNNSDALLSAVRSVYAQTYSNWELLIVGDDCPALDKFMETHKPLFRNSGRHVRWFNLNRAHGGAGGHAPRNYAVKALASGSWIAYLNDDDAWAPDHLQTMVAAVRQKQKATFAFASQCDGIPHNESTPCSSGDRTRDALCTSPSKACARTSTLMHTPDLVRKYGAWRRMNETLGSAHDWELVSRWIEGGEPWVASKWATVALGSGGRN